MTSVSEGEAPVKPRATQVEILTSSFLSAARTLAKTAKVHSLHASVAAIVFCFLALAIWLAGDGSRPGDSLSARFNARVRLVGVSNPKGSLLHPPALSFSEDFFAVITSNEEHFPLVEASREWRQGIHAVVGINFQPSIAQTQEAARWNETLFYYPDDTYVKSFYAGDSRAAIMPLVAKALGREYKWLLYGDDDTMFFLDNLAEMLRPFDPQLPYLITDHLWWHNGSEGYGNEHPEPGAPRCVPCHWNTAQGSLNGVLTRSAAAAYPPEVAQSTGLQGDAQSEPWLRELWRFPSVTGCPCTSRLLCEIEARRRLSGQDLFQRLMECSSEEPPLPGAFYSIHGGAGAVLSRGLLDQVDSGAYEACANSRGATGGDMLLTHCLWVSGFAATDPGGAYHHPSRQMFDPGQQSTVQDLLDAVDRTGNCTADCTGRLQSMVSLHVRSRELGIERATRTIKQVASLHAQWQQGEQVDILVHHRRTDSMVETS